MGEALFDIETGAEQWYRANLAGPILDKGAFIDAVSACYQPGFTYVDLEGEIPLTTESKVNEFIQGFSDWLDESPGWNADLVEVQTQALNEFGCLLVAEYRLTNADGRSVAEGDTVQYFYVLAKKADGFKVISEGTVAAKTRIQFGSTESANAGDNDDG